MNTKDLDDFFLPDEPPPEPVREPAPPPTPPSQPPPPPSQEPRKKQQQAHKNSVPELRLENGLPANVDAEKTILGSILLENKSFFETIETLDASDFSLDSHQRIYLRMAELMEDKRPVDIVTLVEELARHKEIESIGGVAYLASLTEGLPMRPEVGQYIRIVADKSIARKIMAISSAIIARAADQSDTAPQILNLLEAQLVELKDRSKFLSQRRNPEPFFVGFKTFIDAYPEKILWTVEGLIQKDGNGLILGDPGTSKSLAVFDLALHLVAGLQWFHHAIPKRARVGLVTREDAPGLSQSRLKRLKEGASEALEQLLSYVNMEEWLFVHTRAQRETWTLQNEGDIREIIEAIKERGIEICFFDVFRVLWHGNENDSQETAEVLEAAKRIGREANCQVALVHHVSKSDRGTIFDRARGSGILGWREWAFGITIENPDAQPRDQIRKMEFQTKADCAATPVYYRIDGYEKMLKLEEVEAPTAQYQYREKKDKGKKRESDTTQSAMPYKDDEKPF